MVYITKNSTGERLQFASPEMAIAFMSSKNQNDYTLIRERIMPWGRIGDPDSQKIAIRKAFI